MTAHDFIKKRKYLIWYVKDYDKLDLTSIVEATLNYGQWTDVQALIKIVGIKKVATVFRKQTRTKRNNYDVMIKNYFTLYFKKYA